jgi:adenylate kinase family enzyme
VHRVVVLGRGGSGKSTLAACVARRTGLPLVELDAVFWSAGLTPLSPAEWATRQSELIKEPAWILDGDLGPYDVLEVRLREADTVLLLDFPLLRCAWRAVRRSSERADFWRWLVHYRSRSLPGTRQAIAQHAPEATLHILRNPREVAAFVRSLPTKAN